MPIIYSENRENRQIQEQRNYKVIKHNSLIQKSRHNLSAQEQKIIFYLVSKIKPEDTELRLYEFRIREFCQICGIDKTSGKNYAQLKNALKTLADKSFWIKISDTEETIVRWVERPYINTKSGTIKIKIDEYMRPYLLELKEHFTKYDLYYTLAMKSKYSLRFYELLKSYENIGKWEFDFEELKKILFAEKYRLFYDFRRRVLDQAMRDINNYGDIFVNYEAFKKGGTDYGIIFKIKLKRDLDDRLETMKKIEKKLNPKQVPRQVKDMPLP